MPGAFDRNLAAAVYDPTLARGVIHLQKMLPLPWKCTDGCIALICKSARNVLAPRAEGSDFAVQRSKTVDIYRSISRPKYSCSYLIAAQHLHSTTGRHSHIALDVHSYCRLHLRILRSENS